MRNKITSTMRELISDGSCYCPSVYDGVSARMASALGFRVGILGGSVASMCIASAPDVNVLTATELAEQARRICIASDLPLIVDADGGYGNALNVMRTVRELEAAGAAAISIEDTCLPKRFGSSELLIGDDEAAAKLEAALSARCTDDFLIIARTHATEEDFGGLMKRVATYTETGVDAICVTGVQSLDQVHAVRSHTKLPLFLITYAGVPLGNPLELENAGVRLWLDGHAPYYAAMRATYEVLKAQAQGKHALAASLAASAELVNEFSCRPAFDLAARSFLKA